jgi:all-trans-retinol 13,14-reductase
LLSVRTPVPNLFLTGQNLMLHGVHGVTMTALFTCAEVLGRERIWNIVTNKKGVEI